MSFTGDLQHLPIVDVIQLLHSTRKSGALTVRGRKGECQLVFSDGFIVSANHLNNRVRIGELLVERDAVSRENLEQALAVQAAAGGERQPLIVTLLELGAVEEQQAYAGLQTLIEMTIVEILTWKAGTFSLETECAKTVDGYQYNPETIRQSVNVDTQGVLMDALRVFDEKVRDGEIQVEDESDLEITADDLGLADLDQLERRVPGVFMGLSDQAAESEDNPVRRLNLFIGALPQVRSVPQLALAQLGYVGETLPRALTLVVRGGELIAEKGIGIRGEQERTAAPLPGFRIPLGEPSRLREAVESGRLYHGPADAMVRGRVFPYIGAPVSEEIVLVPVQGEGRTVFLTFADFGDQPAGKVPVDLLEMLAGQSGQALEQLLRRKNA